MTETLKIFIPMAGWGTRMRPHTWSKPKPLVSVAGKTSLEHLLDMFKTLPDPNNVEFVFIVGPYLGELQVPLFIQENYPQMKAHFVVQNEMKGQSHALWLAREYMHGPMLMVFSDTLMETDFSFLANEEADVVAWVMPMDDPRRFGVAEVGPDGWVKRFIEKPQSLDNNLVVVGCYYFKEAEKLLAAIEEQMERNLSLKGEYFLTDTVSIMIEHGAKVRINEIHTWLDTGTIDATLDTNKLLLEKMEGSSGEIDGVEIISPSFVHASAEIQNSVIGPHASIGAYCRITNSTILESIIEAKCEIQHGAESLFGGDPGESPRERRWAGPPIECWGPQRRPSIIMIDTVECRSDSEYAERPLSLTWEGVRYEIAEIVARWRGPAEKGFRVKTANGLAFDLTYRELPDEWLIQPI